MVFNGINEFDPKHHTEILYIYLFQKFRLKNPDHVGIKSFILLLLRIFFLFIKAFVICYA